MKRIRALALVLAAAASPAMARAQVADFEGLTLTQYDVGCQAVATAAVPYGYAGLNWDAFFVVNPGLCLPGEPHPNAYDLSGFTSGRVSGTTVGFAGFGFPSSIWSAAPFTFNSMYLTAAWNDQMPVTVTGWSGGSALFTETLLLDSHAPTLFTFNWAGVEKVDLSSDLGNQGVNAGYGGAGPMFVVDDLTFNAEVVPEPATLLLLGTGLAGLAALRRRRKGATR